MRRMDRVREIYHQNFDRNPLVRGLVFYLKKWSAYLSGRYERYRPPTWFAPAEKARFPHVRFAAVCDELTWENLHREFEAVYLTPQNWRRELERVRPDLFFCEAAWSGIDGSWESGVFRDRNLKQDNRFVLRDILRYCRMAGIPTVFWNKEDTPAFSDGTYSFIDTALLFDHIFTTAKECIPKYQALGHGSVHCMMFGVSPELFPLLPPVQGPETAVFFGSWYGNNPVRCEDTVRLFDAVLERGMSLKIYDRASEQRAPERQFPDKYQPYIHPAIPYEQTWEAMRGAKYVLNINSVKDSETMFARRVFEAMACGRVLISNGSKGLRKLFPDGIWFVGERFDPGRYEEIAVRNRRIVMKNYTFSVQMEGALEAAGICEKERKEDMK